MGELQPQPNSVALAENNLLGSCQTSTQLIRPLKWVHERVEPIDS